MGGRLSVPRGPDGTNEISRPTAPRQGVIINRRTIVAPIAAFTMACLLFFYTRTSIQAARLNAQKHRDADGGQLNWRNESLRRHGRLEKIDDKSLIKEAFLGEKPVSQEEVQAQAAAMRRKSRDEYDPGKALDELKRTPKPSHGSE